jgi:hypothetical protein
VNDGSSLIPSASSNACAGECHGGIMFLFLARGLPSVWADINDIVTIAKALKDAKWQNCKYQIMHNI